MKTLFLDLSMGAAGDMLVAAVLPLLEEQEAFFAALRQFEDLGVRISCESASSMGIWGHRFNVLVHEAMEESIDVDAAGQPLASTKGYDHNHAHTHEHADEHTHGHEEHSHNHVHEHGNHSHANVHGDHDPHSHAHTHDNAHGDHSHPHIHRGLNDIIGIIEKLELPAQVKKDAIAVYTLLAEAEAHSHQVPVAEIHFHEVGTLDAICDIVAFSLLIHLLQPETVLATPVSTGSGFVRCAHGILPVPAPATSYLLRKIPSYSGSIKGELLTPTGAALLSHFVQNYRERPLGLWHREGLGLGHKEYPALNAVRAWLGEAKIADPSGSKYLELKTEQLKLLETDLDDLGGEDCAFVAEKLRIAGALDVVLCQVIMKKGRPGVRLSVLCRSEQVTELARLILRHTTTLGIRISDCERMALDREVKTVDSPLGSIRCKFSQGAGLSKTKLEYEDLARLASDNDLTLSEVRALAANIKVYRP
ncbi:MAG: nickel pincer cofactor biosynthesis protein LarC [Saccharofermentanales bacterium]|jgi:uncharacterized protein (TIGR00299 family) protein